MRRFFSKRMPSRRLLLATAGITTAAVSIFYFTRKYPDIDDEPPTIKYDPIHALPIVNKWGNTHDSDLPNLVILGSGWGSTSILKGLDPKKFNTIVISPTNYFLFTPLLPEATTGTVESRSLLESIRHICSPSNAKFIEAEATDLDIANKFVQVKGKDSKEFLVPFDKLVVAVGAKNITMGVEGVDEYTCFLKTIADARKIRQKIVSLFEEASLPTQTEEQRKSMLSFVVCGGGPTGIEFAAELSDLVEQDLSKTFPQLKKFVSISVISSPDHILNTFAQSISEFAEDQFKRQNINVITKARVTKVNKDTVVFKQKSKETPTEIPFGLCIWSTGVGQREISEKIIKKINVQTHTRAMEVDSRLNLIGANDVYAIGDCSTIQNPQLLSLILTSLKKTNLQKLDLPSFRKVAKDIVTSYPQTTMHLKKVEQLFDDYDKDKSGFLELDELEVMVRDINKVLTSLPATAQVAAQQGEYLAKKLNNLPSKTPLWTEFEKAYKPFHYKHLGAFSYVGGNNAIVDLGEGRGGGGGVGVFLLWRGAYLSKQVSMRTRTLIGVDWGFWKGLYKKLVVV